MPACYIYLLFDLVQWLDLHLAAALCIIRFRDALICAVRLQMEEKKRRATQKKQREEASRRQEEEERKARAAAEAARATGRCSTCHTTYLECCLACITLYYVYVSEEHSMCSGRGVLHRCAQLM